MFVIDYVRRLHVKKDEKGEDKAWIEVAPYHRGHLGLMPGTPVSIALMGYGRTHPNGYEVSITPFKPRKSLFFLSVTLEDQKGVVAKLFKAIGSLKLNIIVQESACINHQNHHVVDLLLDWSSSSHLDPIPMPKGAKYRMQAFSGLMPLDDFRFAILLARILAYCGDALFWKRASRGENRQLPAITISRAFEGGNVIDDSGGEVIPLNYELEAEPEGTEGKPKPKKVGIEIPGRILASLERSTGFSSDEELHYIALSEGPRRNLRVFFPIKEKAQRIVHVAFIHDDSAGALAAIAEAVKKNFNIITSLLRRHDTKRQVWEAHLEYRPEDEDGEAVECPAAPEDEATAEELLVWVKEKLEVEKRERSALAYYQVRLGTPKYPDIRRFEKVLVDLFEESDKPRPMEQEPVADVFRAEYARFAGRVRLETRRRRQYVYRYVAPLVVSKPTVFLSYPSTRAAGHAAYVRDTLARHFDVVDGMAPSGKQITESVAKKIMEADYFLGIWHPEPEDPALVSPWLLFEFGIARSHGKDVLIVVNNSISETVWKRIDPGISKFHYSDLDFRPKTLEEIERHVIANWPHHSQGYSLGTGADDQPVRLLSSSELFGGDGETEETDE